MMVKFSLIFYIVEKQLRHRYVKHYGYEFLYGSNTVDKERPLPHGMPSECSPVIDKIVSLGCVKHQPDQLTINEYLPGQGKVQYVMDNTEYIKRS